jgi:hypothetical protein
MALAQAWSDNELEKLCQLMSGLITHYQTRRRDDHDSVDLLIELCTKSLKPFELEQQLRKQERDPGNIALLERYPVGTQVLVCPEEYINWHEAIVTEHLRGGWIRVRITTGPMSGLSPRVIRSQHIRPRGIARALGTQS